MGLVLFAGLPSKGERGLHPPSLLGRIACCLSRKQRTTRKVYPKLLVPWCQLILPHQCRSCPHPTPRCSILALFLRFQYGPTSVPSVLICLRESVCYPFPCSVLMTSRYGAYVWMKAHMSVAGTPITQDLHALLFPISLLFSSYGRCPVLSPSCLTVLFVGRSSLPTCWKSVWSAWWRSVLLNHVCSCHFC